MGRPILRDAATPLLRMRRIENIGGRAGTAAVTKAVIGALD
jgi:hypothetical protein